MILGNLLKGSVRTNYLLKKWQSETPSRTSMKMRRKKNVPEATYTMAEAKLMETLLRSEDMMQLVRPMLRLRMRHTMPIKRNNC